MIRIYITPEYCNAIWQINEDNENITFYSSCNPLLLGDHPNVVARWTNFKLK